MTIQQSDTVTVDAQLEYIDKLHEEKYRDPGQPRPHHAAKMALGLASNPRHQKDLFDILHSQRFLPAGRVQAALGSSRESSPFNCAVSGTIPDSMEGIMERVKEAALTLRLGTGIGYDFSTLRPQGAPIRTLKSNSSGPLSFMRVFDAMAGTIHMSHRRGAQMGMMSIHHPDIEKFITAKMEKQLSVFNLSVAVTDEFMQALSAGKAYERRFEGQTYGYWDAQRTWDMIMSCAWESAEPGIIFIDRVNHWNNLNYCEDIRATNPCAEQPLPPYGMCLLGSFNLTQYLKVEQKDQFYEIPPYSFDYDKLDTDVRVMVEAYDNIFERSLYALPQHKEEALAKRRMGLGLTGIANAVERMGHPYGSKGFLREFENIAQAFRDSLYMASVRLAGDRGAFPLYNKDHYLHGAFIETLPAHIQGQIGKHGIRNSHLISYAPCGTISIAGGNVSSGVEPVFYLKSQRTIKRESGDETITLEDYNLRNFGLKAKTLEQCTISDHLGVAAVAQRYCDSSVSKTINVAPDCSLEEYSSVWKDAYLLDIKGMTVYRPNAIRPPIIKSGDCEGDSCTIS